MEAKVGDRVSIDAFKVGQPRRWGTIKQVTEGISGIRYEVEWDDGHRSSFSPKAGNLIVEGRARTSNSKKGAGSKSKSGKSAKRKR